VDTDPYSLINEVNQLRAARGLPAYATSPILMSVAQQQAQYMASAGVTHFGPDGSKPWQRGLAAYRTNANALAERALQAAFPVVAELIGFESFALMARQFWHRHPPERGDLAWWGAALPDFLAHDPQLADVPYLADVARVEWALHRIASAADAPVQPASFELLNQQDPDTVTLQLPPTATCDSDNDTGHGSAGNSQASWTVRFWPELFRTRNMISDCSPGRA